MTQPTTLIATPDPLPPLSLATVTEESLAAWKRAVYAQAAQAAVRAVAVSLSSQDPGPGRTLRVA